MKNKHFVCSWSGGKDSAMAFYRAVQSGAVPKRIWTMFETDEKHSKSHALPLEIIEAQAKSIGVPFMIRGADWNGYEAQFLDAMKECVEADIEYGVFGDIDLEDHLTWVQNACAKVGMKALHPLWQEPRRKILDEFLEAGFEAYIVVGHDKRLPQHFVGQQFTKELMGELEALGIDSCGEEGEFHTLVVNGPIFKRRIPVKFGETIHRDGYTFLDVKLEMEGEGMSMDQQEVRWIQRFENFSRSFNLLEKYGTEKPENELEQAGIIQFFEMSFELSWKVMKDYLEAEGLIVKSPRETIKTAIQIELIMDGHDWMDALGMRNSTVHLYDEKAAKEAVEKISKLYIPIMKKLKTRLEKELEECSD